jgi:hypothetical protein
MEGMPKGVWFQVKRDKKTGRVKARYGYYGRGPGAIPLGREGTPEFHENLADALRREPEKGKLANLIWQYKQSQEFAKLGPRTRQDYVRQLDKVQAKFGDLSYRAIEHKAIIPHLYKWRDEMARTSAKQANYAVTVLKLTLAWGVKRGVIDRNMAANVSKLTEGDRREMTWSAKDEAAFIAKAPETLQWAIILAIKPGSARRTC